MTKPKRRGILKNDASSSDSIKRTRSQPSANSEINNNNNNNNESNCECPNFDCNSETFRQNTSENSTKMASKIQRQKSEKKPVAANLLDLPNEILAGHIMTFISDPKEKLLVGVVCRKLNQVVATREAWADIQSLNICIKRPAPGPVWAPASINGVEVAVESVEKYLNGLLKRISIKYVSLYKCFHPDSYRRAIGHVLNLAVAGRAALRSLKINAQSGIGGAYVTPLLSAFSASLEKLMIMESDVDEAQTNDMWKLIEKCQNLREFTFLASEPDTDMSDPAKVVSALSGKSLNTLGLNGIKQLSTDNVISVVESMCEGMPKKLEVCYSGNVSLAELSSRLSKQRRQCVEDFEFAFVDTFELTSIYQLASLFPNLKRLDLDYWVTDEQEAFPTSVIIKTIKQFLACNNRTVKLNMLCEGTDLIHVIGSLVSRRECQWIGCEDREGRQYYRIKKENNSEVHFYTDNYAY